MGTKNTAFSSFSNIEGPYKATKLWNEVVRAFRSELPRGCHRRRMKTHEDCFVASDAVDWLWQYLRTSPHFGPHVCRQQATQLLQKFLQCNLIEDLSGKKKNGVSVLEDNKDLYRVKKSTPLKSPAPNCLKKIMRSPLVELPNEHISSNVPKESAKPVQIIHPSSVLQGSLGSNLVQAELEQKVLSSQTGTLKCQKYFGLTPMEIACIWKSVLWNKLSVLVTLTNLESILKPTDVHGATIIHNVTNLQKNGIVHLTDKTDDIPNWILCAMKCLAKWPNASGSSSCLPNYPGFEKDVFKVVKEYFLSLSEPLIPAQFFGIISAVYEMAIATQKLSDGDSGSFRSTSVASLSSAPISNNSSSCVNYKEILKDKKISSSELHLNTRSQPVQKSYSSYDNNVLQLEKRTSYCFETAFTEEYPATRIVPRPTVSMKSTGYSNPAFSDDQHLTCRNIQLCSTPPDYFRSLERKTKKPGQRVAPLHSASVRCISLDHLAGQSKRFNFERKERKRIGLHQVYYGKPFDPDINAGRQIKTASCDNLSIGSSGLSTDSDQTNMVIHNPYTNTSDSEHGTGQPLAMPTVIQKPCLNPEKGPAGMKEYRGTSTIGESSRNSSDLHRPLSIPRSHKLVKCFQLVLLLIPIASRRKLHLLLRFLNKVKINRSLDLFPDEYAPATIVKMFWKSILKTPGVHVDEEEKAVVFQVVEFLLDHCEAILSPPIELKIEVDNILTLLNQSRMRQPQTGWNADDFDGPTTFCEQVTKQMYEEQKVCMLRSSLKELLEEIISNPSLTEKEKTKKLDKFRKQYPEVYAERFPIEEEHKMKRKRSLLRKLKDMRL